MLSQNSLFEQIRRITTQPHRRFYMPGHKGRIPEISDWTSLDITEIPGADNLHRPGEIIASLEEKIAGVYGAEKSFITVGGTTVGMQAAILSLAEAGQKILVPANSHRCVFSGLVLADAEGIFFQPEIDATAGFASGVSVRQVERQLAENPDICGMVLTSPTYFGTFSDVGAIADTLHHAGKWLIVDEAHGAHLPFGGQTELSAVACGADIIVQSAHKTLRSFTQTGMLHLGTKRVSPERVRRLLAVLESSSPSYPLMMSIEYGIEDGLRNGKAVLNMISDRRKAYLEQQSAHNALSLYTPPKEVPYDDTKWLFTAQNGGDEAEFWLRQRGIWCEFATADYVLAYLGLGTTEDDIEALTNAVDAYNANHPLKSEAKTFRSKAGFSRYPDCLNQSRAELKKALLGDAERVDLKDAAGRISADFIIPYPPGSPVVLPGSQFSREMCSALQHAAGIGETLLGIIDGKVAVLKGKNL